MDFASSRADGMRDEPLVQLQPSASLHSLHPQDPVRQGHTQIHASRRDVAAALDAERAWARVALDTVGDAVLTIDLQGAITYMNRMAEILTGWSEPEAIGKPLSRVLLLVDSKTHQTTITSGRRAIEENRAVGLSLDCALVRQDGSELEIEDSAAPIHDRDGRVTGAVIVFRDASMSQVTLDRMAYLAQHDALTGLANRTLMTERLSQAIGLARRHRHLVALLYLDLDAFKPINDSLGHAVGDSLLQAVAGRLRDCMRDIDTVCRQGGDEFAILLAEIRKPDDATKVAEKLLAVLSRPYRIEGHELLITLSIGISLYPDDADDADALMHNADMAMYHTKRNGRNGHQCFTAEMNTLPILRRRTEPGMHRSFHSAQLFFDF
ncbi:diguanylate cyclase domain-containing protein [Halomonas alkalisoli]|uniref:diguanylate cyclase domain-containing protein n=1 Tax=Halomonas alkalisoli TaxID=2907158 RepID=UPI001F1ACDBA|nr:diguanylate cyclase [Halomonas alkalisoli]MCE9681968.1 diguanylate cyclase [Halomonas alkalisoli]